MTHVMVLGSRPCYVSVIEVERDVESKSLASSEWYSYFAGVGKTLYGKRVHIEIVDAALGDQVLVGSLLLVGITYEPKRNMLEILLEGLDHLIEKPKAISVQEDSGTPVALEIIDREGRHQIVTLA
ncbi:MULTISPECIES: DUF5335 family protein [Sinorhizobium]|uniref:Uncharacterized protein n=2 Tax=Rhizobium meliloti TaxID=382 RepID=Q1WLJ2_SINMM|nr:MULTISPECIES: DUF5335 family protein [Sinorhizobium]ABA56008.1 hypothetical protein [Sinorhizobium meliloti]MBP2471050.1 putative RecA/RadA family phage recombinase [Sinorhizobium meliloti]MCM5693585.1 DUF5335 domain-containing protein [Sinorhizobium meliloti]MDE4553330.1 DUF5335 domain-containing protein [Sinorhizobium meliloti]MDE4561675.1 DUF5335 domain-containing protein [Sinorhizobium meliloti SM11]